MNKIYLSSFSSSWQTNAPHIPAVLHCYAEQFPSITSHYNFEPYFFHTKFGVTELVNSMDNPFLVGSNIISWNERRTHKFLAMTRKKFPATFTLAGGNNVPKVLPHDYFKRYPYIDMVIHGEGEAVFSELLERLIGKSRENIKELIDISGMSLNLNGEVFTTPLQKKLGDEKGVIDYPSPFLTHKFDDYFRIVDKMGELRGGVWETTRGCPYSCTFCDWGQLTQSKVRKFSDERIFSEIKYLVDNFDEVFFADANFGILHRDVEIAKQLCDYWKASKDRRLKTVHIGGAKNSNERMLEIGKAFAGTSLTRAGMSLSLQTYSEAALKAIKRKNIKSERFNELQALYKSYNIPTYCDLIINCPNETYSTFKETLNFAIKQDFTDIRMFTMDIYPNSEIIDDIDQYKIKTKKYKIYTGHEEDENEFIEKVISTDTMDAIETEQLRKVCRAIEILHLGRWTKFIAEYLNRSLDVKYADFYEALYLRSLTQPDSILGLALSEGFIKKYNKGDSSRFCGEFSPFGIEWKTSYFSKELYTWLCIAYFREQFYKELNDFLNETYSNWNPEVTKFNNLFIYSHDYNPKSGQTIEFDFNWYDYFNSHDSLRKRPNKLHISDTFVGRDHDSKPIEPANPAWLRWAAGGRSYFLQRQASYTYQKVKVEYLDGEFCALP